MEEYENIKIGRRQKVKVILISLLVFLMSVIGATYAYFLLNITGNGSFLVCKSDRSTCNWKRYV